MSDLTDFLLARIGEDEAVARAATQSVKWWDYATGHVRAHEGAYIALNLAAPDAAQIARWDPARVLAECEAKRQIVAWCSEFNLIDINVVSSDPADPANYIPGAPTHPTDAPVLRMLALPYADHPGYRQEWA